MKEIEAPTVAYNQPREWMLWTAATIGGWVIGSAVSYLLSIVLSVMGYGEALNANPADVSQETMLVLTGASLLMLFIIGTGTGALQWLVLRRHVVGLQRWGLLTGLGFVLGWFVFPPAMGLGVGLLQWLLLRRDLNKTAWWPVMSTLAWPLGYMFGGGAGMGLGQAFGSPLIANLLSAVFTGAIIGALTGVVLLWLLRENAALLESLRQEREAELAAK